MTHSVMLEARQMQVDGLMQYLAKRLQFLRFNANDMRK